MLQLSTAAILEKNKIAQDSVWLTLLEIQAPDSTIIRLCHNTENITWNGQQWIAFPFTVDSVKQNKTEVPQVPIRVSNVTRAIERVIEQYAGFVGCEVILRVVMSKHLELTTPEVEETFTVQGTSSDNEWATFNLGGSMPIMLRFPFRRILKDWCPFVYCDVECGIPISVKSLYPNCNQTLTACRLRHTAAGYTVIRFGGEPSMSQGGLYASNQ